MVRLPIVAGMLPLRWFAPRCKVFIKRYQLQTAPDAVPGGFFARQAVQPLISQPRAVGARYYYGMPESGIPLLLLVGVSANRNDILDGEPVKVSVLNPPLSGSGLVVQAVSHHQISLEDAARLTFNYRSRKAPGQPHGGFFGKAALQRVLSQPGCTGIRFWFGVSEDSIRNLVMLGVNQYGMDMFHGALLEMSSLCPPLCDKANPLNSSTFSAKGAEPEYLPAEMDAQLADAA